MKRVLMGVFLLLAVMLSACGPQGSSADVDTVSWSQSLTDEEVMVVNAFASLRRASPTRWQLTVAGTPVVLDQDGQSFSVVAGSQELFNVTSAAIALDLRTFEEEPAPPETNAIKLKWVGKLIKAIGKVLGGGGTDTTGANACGSRAAMVCGAGCVESMSSTLVSCKFTCKSGGSCGGGRL